eukprot:812027-Prorocentrum_lima.AAC.1
MATYWRLYQSREAVFAELDALLEEADRERPGETVAATRVQSLFRGWRVREWMYVQKVAGQKIQR